MAVSSAQADWAAAKNRNEFVAILTFDLSAAFDTFQLMHLVKNLGMQEFTIFLLSG